LSIIAPFLTTIRQLSARHDKLLFGESSQKLCLKLQPLAILAYYAVPSRSPVL
jgi:hypothetical protein